MAVFTDVALDEARGLVERLDIGALRAVRGIQAGIENSNFFLDTDRGTFVLTLFERLTFEQLPFYLHLMKHLALRGIPVPEPQADAQGEILHSLYGKPAAVVDKLAGGHQLAPGLHHCEQVGAMVARMHLAGLDFGLHQPNLRGVQWWSETVPLVRPFLTADQLQLIDSELAYQQALAGSAALQGLPKGPIHADLFRDNVMFEEGKLTGFFDFYFAGVDSWLFDIAVCLNDWAIDLPTGVHDPERARAFVAAYASVRPLSRSMHQSFRHTPMSNRKVSTPAK